MQRGLQLAAKRRSGGRGAAPHQAHRDTPSARTMTAAMMALRAGGVASCSSRVTDAENKNSSLHLQPAPARKRFTPSAFIMGTGVDDIGTVVKQEELSQAVSKILMRGVVTAETSLGSTLEKQAERVGELFIASGVKKRGALREVNNFFVPTSDCADLGNASLVNRMEAAARSAIDEWVQRGGEGPGAITHIMIGSLTPPRSAPGPDLQLIAALGLRTETQRVPQHHLGSHGGFRLLSLAAQIARGNPTARILVVYGDIWSLAGNYLPSTLTEADVCSLALYGDGAAAAVVSGSPRDADRAAAHIMTGCSELLPAAASSRGGKVMRLAMHYNKATHGFALESVPLGADPDAAESVIQSARPFLDRVWGEYAAATTSGAGPPPKMADAAVLLSAGDAAMAGRVASALGLAREQVEHSSLLLEERGNMSGASNIASLHRLLRDGRGATRAVGIAYGEGLTQEGVVFEVQR